MPSNVSIEVGEPAKKGRDGKDLPVTTNKVGQFLDWFVKSRKLLESMILDAGFLPYSYEYYLKIKMEASV
ncbi:MAG: hypothetical protein HWN67_23005 [Candidatus Helarchaeota archaeon]|nr:hypothetical protein [Candidatus Helarchaeota archaeon]